METHVYANDREICSKNADGKSAFASPDVCHSPPAPANVGAPVPYPNTSYAKDLENGSKTVFICNQQIALENHSYFATSTGNEPATEAFKKGSATGVIKGKAYFTSWSVDVKVEGKGVCRHLDGMTHNHG